MQDYIVTIFAMKPFLIAGVMIIVMMISRTVHVVGAWWRHCWTSVWDTHTIAMCFEDSALRDPFAG